MNPTEREQPIVRENDKRDNARVFLGPLVVLSAALLSIVFTGANSFTFGIGYTVAKLFISIALALPIFIVVKYASRYGRQLGIGRAINLFCYLVVACWIIQVILGFIVPTFMQRISYNQTLSIPAQSLDERSRSRGNEGGGNYFDRFDKR